jgi:MFS family permease
MTMGLAFTIIGDVFSPAERGKYSSFFAAAWGLASIFGPTRLPHRPHLLARGFLRKPACGNRCDSRYFTGNSRNYIPKALSAVWIGLN